MKRCRELERKRVERLEVDLSGIRGNEELLRVIDFDFSVIAKQGVEVQLLAERSRDRGARRNWKQAMELLHDNLFYTGVVRMTFIAIVELLLHELKSVMP